MIGAHKGVPRSTSPDGSVLIRSAGNLSAKIARCRDGEKFLPRSWAANVERDREADLRANFARWCYKTSVASLRRQNN
jgi:hypothetical protein